MGTVVETSTATSSYTVETIPGGEPLGLENGTIPDDCISASSSAGPAPPHLARLNGLSAWCAGKAEDCYLQVNLGSLHLLCAVATQGNPGGNRDYVKRYKLKSSVDGENWSTYEENGNDIIEGNTNNWGAKKKELEKEIITRYVRFCPVDWYCWPCLRVELYGAALNIADKFPSIQSEDGGSYVVEKVLVTTYETHVDENGVPDEASLKEQEKQIIRDAKERQRIEEEQQNRLEEIQIFIEQEEVKRKPSVEDMDDDERKEAEARIQLVLSEELALERREKPDGEDRLQRDVEEEKHDRVTREYNRIDEEHRKRMEALTAIIGDDEERRRKEKEERRKEEEDARRKREEERRAKEDELKRKREEERLKWEEEHRKWEEERKKRDQELEALLEEGRKKRAEERKKRDEELRKMREDDRRKREEERKKRMDEEMRKLDQLKKEREERWNKKTEVVISGIDLDVSGKEGEDAKNRQDDKKRKEDGWMKRVETPRVVEEEMKKFRDEERKRLEEERKRLLEKEISDAEAEKELKSEIRVMRQEKPETITKVSVASIQLATPQDIGEEKRRIEWRMQKIEQDRLLREEEERKRREQAERKKKEDEERAMQEVERIRKEQEEERERRKEEMRLRKEADERKKREEEDRKRQEEEARRHMTLEERRKRLEEDRKKREDEERVWRREMEERKRKEEEEKRKEEENKKRKRLSIDRKRFEEEEKKRLDEIGRKRSEEEEKERMEDERRRREERERWKLKQAERRRSGEIYRNKSEEDLRKREERYSFKEKQRKQRGSKSFEIKWEFINGERVAVPVDESFVSATSETSYSEPNGSDVFDDDTPEISYVTANTVEAKRIPSTDEQDSSRVTSTIRVITTTTTRTRYHDHHDHHHPRLDSEETSLNGEVMPFRSQPHCDHLLPTDPSVQEAVEMSFFDKYEENEGKLRPFPSWYGGLDMGSLPHLYLPSNPIRDSDIDLLVSIENEGLKSWKRVKKSGELEIYSRKGLERGSPPVTKAIMVLKDIPYRDAIDLVSDWDERSKWDKTFDGVSFLDQMADFKLLKCSQKKKNRCAVLASLDREDEEPYYAWAWKGSNHPSVPGEDSKLTVMRLETGICGAIIRPYHDATRSSKITIITQVRGSVPSPLKSTYLTGNPSKWLIWMKKHHNSQVKTAMDKEQDDDKNKDDASSVSSKSDKQD